MDGRRPPPHVLAGGHYPTDRLVSATLRLGPPPDFAVGDEGSLPGLQSFLAKVWTLVEPLYESSRQADAQALEAMADLAETVIQGAVDYSRGKAPCNTWKVIAEPLALPGHPSSYTDGATAWIVLSPASDTWQRDLAREAYGLLVRDELAQLQGQRTLDRFQPVRETVGFGGDLPAYIKENLAWALTARALDVSDTKGALDRAAEQGFVLAPALCEKLADYEASGLPLRGYLGQLLGSIDVDKVLASTPPDWTKWYWGPPPIVQGWILRVRTEGTISFPAVGGAELAVALGEQTETSVSLGIGAVDEGGTKWMVFWSQGWAETVVPGKITPTTLEPGKMTLSGTGVIWAFHMYELNAPDPPPWQIKLTSTESGK